MHRPTLLWVDLTTRQGGASPASGVHIYGTIHRETHPSAIATRVRQVAPWLLVFEYDYPRARSLEVLRQTKREFPGIPLLMLTEHHSESLAVWAFRTGVRDFRVKPLDTDLLGGLIRTFAVEPAARGRSAPRANRTPPEPIPFEVCRSPNAGSTKSTLPAARHAELHYPEKITLDVAADLCQMSSHQFSRAFKKEHGENFRDFLVRIRIEKAKDLLQDPSATVREIAHRVGFADPNQFTRMFRRQTGMSPSLYRLNEGCPTCVVQGSGFGHHSGGD